MKGENTMEQLPEVDVGFRELYRIFITPTRSKLFMTGIKSGQKKRR